MTGALIILAVTVTAGIILYLTRDKRQPESSADSDTTSPGGQDEPQVCCGRHAVCEKGLLKPEELYYNDEELDRFAGWEPDVYTPSEVEEFREVLYTLQPSEVYSWGAALTQRNIALPIDIRDEWVMLCQ